MFAEKTPNEYSQELKAKRETLGLTLSDIFQRTRISVAYLQAIENNEFHLLPVSVYTKNFIKTYARTLGVDSEPILACYKNYLNSQKGIQTQSSKNDAPEKKNIFTRIAGLKTYGVIAAVLVIISIAAWLISIQYRSSSEIINSPEGITGIVAGKGEQNTNSALDAATSSGQQLETSDMAQKVNEQSQIMTQPGSLKEKNPLDSKSVKPVVDNKETVLFMISAIEETWLRIRADQNPSFQILLKAGEKYEFKAASVKLKIGNAGGIKIQFKGKSMENLGRSGQVIHLRLP